MAEKEEGVCVCWGGGGVAVKEKGFSMVYSCNSRQSLAGMGGIGFLCLLPLTCEPTNQKDNCFNTNAIISINIL